MNTFVAVDRKTRKRLPVEVTPYGVLKLACLPYAQQRMLRFSKRRGWYYFWYSRRIHVSLRVQAKGRWVQ